MRYALHAVGPPGPPAIRVLIAEGSGLLRAGLRALLETEPGLWVVAEAGTGEHAVAAARATAPDVVLMDAGLPGLGGVGATERILAGAAPGATGVVMLLADGEDALVFPALRAGAKGVLLEDGDPPALVAALRAVARGDAALAPSVARQVVADLLRRPERLHSTPEELEELTAREREVVGLVACGLTNEEIAERLVVTRATAKTHVSRAMCKLHARDRAQLVVLAYETGLVRSGPPLQAPRVAALATGPRLTAA
jgi:DNA-binding NarL/FixJ family response regulator